jgi:hypothetical protein
MITRTYIGLGRTLKRTKISTKDILDLYELKYHKTWFDEKCLFLDKWKHAKMHWLQDPTNRICEVGR